MAMVSMGIVVVGGQQRFYISAVGALYIQAL
jgi:hypothetical protein